MNELLLIQAIVGVTLAYKPLRDAARLTNEREASGVAVLLRAGPLLRVVVSPTADVKSVIHEARQNASDFRALADRADAAKDPDDSAVPAFVAFGPQAILVSPAELRETAELLDVAVLNLERI